MKNIREAVDFLRREGVDAPEVGIILGSGLSKLAGEISAEKVIPYANIPHFPVSTVEFHRGELIYGVLSGKKVLAMQGRFHFYEGYSAHEITLPVRVMKLLGIEHLLISNACGAMNTDFKKGELMIIEDHINLLPNPLAGPNLDELGPRFPDMSRPYDQRMNDLMREIALEKKIRLHSGVYVAVAGPNLETRAEYRYLRRIGADVVGMSTTPEVIVAHHMGLPVSAVSVITDECDPDHLEKVDIRDILKNAARAEKGLSVIFSELVGKLQ